MKVFEKTVVYEQEKDCCDGDSMYCQTLTVQTQDGGGGNFIVLKTDRWAIDKDDIGTFCAQLQSILNDME